MNPWDPEEEYSDMMPKGVQTTRHGPAKGRQLPSRSQRGAPEGSDPDNREDVMPGAATDGEVDAAKALAALLHLMQNQIPSGMTPPSSHPEYVQQNMAPQMRDPYSPSGMGNMIDGWSMGHPTGYPDDARPVQTTREKPRRK